MKYVLDERVFERAQEAFQCLMVTQNHHNHLCSPNWDLSGGRTFIYHIYVYTRECNPLPNTIEQWRLALYVDCMSLYLGYKHHPSTNHPTFSNDKRCEWYVRYCYRAGCFAAFNFEMPFDFRRLFVVSTTTRQFGMWAKVNEMTCKLCAHAVWCVLRVLRTVKHNSRLALHFFHIHPCRGVKLVTPKTSFLFTQHAKYVQHA